jgi:hypothetical protein
VANDGDVLGAGWERHLQPRSILGGRIQKLSQSPAPQRQHR